jgi:hypothetical protein
MNDREGQFILTGFRAWRFWNIYFIQRMIFTLFVSSPWIWGISF